MASTSLKVKAVCLILLLAGQEAHRIQLDARWTPAMQNSLAPAENRWNEVNKQCTWKIQKIFRGGCSGEGCTFRPLSLDRSLSESCRLSDKYMLSNKSRRGEFVELAAQILEAKSAKFKDGCAGAKLWEVSKQFRCHRRAGHMLRSAALLSKAAKVDESSTHENQHVERALNNIANAFGPDGQHLLEFKDKLKGDMSGFAKDPTGKFRVMISTVSKLLSGSERGKDEARQAIREMSSKNCSRDSRKVQKQLEAASRTLIREYSLDDPTEVREAWSSLDSLASNHEYNEVGSALLQTEEQGSNQYQNWFLRWLFINLVLNVLILIICVIFGITNFFWVLLVVLFILLAGTLLGGLQSGAKRPSDGPMTSNMHPRRAGDRHGRRTGKRHW